VLIRRFRIRMDRSLPANDSRQLRMTNHCNSNLQFQPRQLERNSTSWKLADVYWVTIKFLNVVRSLTFRFQAT